MNLDRRSKNTEVIAVTEACPPAHILRPVLTPLFPAKGWTPNLLILIEARARAGILAQREFSPEFLTRSLSV